MRKKKILARVLYFSGVCYVARLLRWRSRQTLPILVYHRVLNVADTEHFPFDVGLIDASIESFRWQMRYLQKKRTPISFGQLAKYLQDGSQLPPNPVIVTFDDGYDDNYHNAFPILKEMGIPATMFLTTGYINSQMPFWYDMLAFLIQNIDGDLFVIKVLDYSRRLPADQAGRRLVMQECVEMMKRIPNNRRLAALAELDNRYGHRYRDADLRIKQMSLSLSWEQCREMSQHGIEFGSHTITHPILTSLSDQELRHELVGSKEAIEKHIGRKVSVLSFPNGGRRDFNHNVVRVAQESGYSMSVSYVGGINKLKQLERNQLKRLTPEPCNDKYVFIMSLTFGFF